MLRNVYLDGELGDRFGQQLKISANSMADVFKCLAGNYSEFRSYLIDCHEKNIGFMCEVQGKPLNDERELLLNFREGDMFISPQPMGSKSGPGKIIAALIAAFVIYTTGFTAGEGVKTWAVTADGALRAQGALAIMATASLANVGVMQMMMPDPATDQNDESYLFQGSAHTIVEGDPIPLLYGELRIPGRPVSMVVRNDADYFYNEETLDSASTNSIDSADAANLPSDQDVVVGDNTVPGPAGTMNPGETNSNPATFAGRDPALEIPEYNVNFSYV